MGVYLHAHTIGVGHRAEHAQQQRQRGRLIFFLADQHSSIPVNVAEIFSYDRGNP
jgi:hypothetical protein